MSNQLDNSGGAPRQGSHDIAAGVPPPESMREDPGRRRFLMTAGMAGAAVLLPATVAAAAGRGGGADSTRPAWLSAHAAGPSNKDWYALRHRLSTHRLIQPGQRGYAAAQTMFDPRFSSLRPAGVAYCRLPSDVAACLSFVTRF